jgi:hypothetical protein
MSLAFAIYTHSGAGEDAISVNISYVTYNVVSKRATQASLDEMAFPRDDKESKTDYIKPEGAKNPDAYPVQVGCVDAVPCSTVQCCSGIARQRQRCLCIASQRISSMQRGEMQHMSCKGPPCTVSRSCASTCAVSGPPPARSMPVSVLLLWAPH